LAAGRAVLPQMLPQIALPLCARIAQTPLQAARESLVDFGVPRGREAAVIFGAMSSVCVRVIMDGEVAAEHRSILDCSAE